MSLHKNVTSSDVHIVYAFSYATAAARTGATGLTSADVGKVAWQTDNNSYWFLVDDSPLTWASLGHSGVTVVTLTDAATVNVDASLGDIFDLTLGGNRTIANPTGVTAADDGKKIIFRLIQDATGNRTVTWSGGYVFGTDVLTPTLSTVAAKVDYVGFAYRSSTSTWHCLATARGY